MTEKPLISIIVAVYNVEKYLPECIESICAQTYTNLEIILVDDGSTDGCPQICDGYAKKDPRIRVIHKKNGGVSSARNVGLDTAKGDYIGFVDSDDCIEPEMYQRMLSVCEAELADMCMCRYMTADEFSVRSVDASGYGQKKAILTGAALLKKLAYSVDNNYAVVWNKLIRKQIMCQLKFIEGKQHEDEHIIHHLYGACGKVVLLGEPLYVYRFRSGSVMREKISLKRLDAMDAYADRVNYLLARNDNELAAHVLVRAIALLVRLCQGMESVDAQTREKISSVRKVFCQLRKKIPDKSLSTRDKIKLFLGLQALPVYGLILRIRNHLTKVE